MPPEASAPVRPPWAPRDQKVYTIHRSDLESALTRALFSIGNLGQHPAGYLADVVLSYLPFEWDKTRMDSEDHD